MGDVLENDVVLKSNNSHLEDVYVDYQPEPTDGVPRTIPAAPEEWSPVAQTFHQYFISLFYQLEDFFIDHWGYFLIGFGLFICFIVIPGIIAQIYCDRLYRKFKREQITRKILEYEAQMEKDSDDDEDDGPRRAPRRAQYSSDSDVSSPSVIKGGRKGRTRGRSASKSRSRSKSTKRSKSGKKVRSHSRPARKHRTRSSDESLASPDVSIKFVKEKKQTKASAGTEMKKTRSTGVDPLPLYSDHVGAEKRFEELRKQRDSGVSMWDDETNSDYYSEPTQTVGQTVNSSKFGNRYNDEPPAYRDDQPENAAANHTVQKFESFATTATSIPTEQTQLDAFNAAKATGVQTRGISFETNVPKLREEPLQPADHRKGYWSAGVISQYNGARTPPVPPKQTKNVTKPTVPIANGAKPISYDEIREMKQHQTHDPKARQGAAPTDYNAALLSITQANDDILEAHRARNAGLIPNLMPVPDRQTPTPPPLIPPKKKTSGINTVKTCPEMKLNRTMHKDGKPQNDSIPDVLSIDNSKVNQSRDIPSISNRTVSTASRKSIREMVADINSHAGFSKTPEKSEKFLKVPETPVIKSEPEITSGSEISASIATTSFGTSTENSFITEKSAKKSFHVNSDDESLAVDQSLSSSLFEPVTPMTSILGKPETITSVTSPNLSLASTRTGVSGKSVKTIMQRPEITESNSDSHTAPTTPVSDLLPEMTDENLKKSESTEIEL